MANHLNTTLLSLFPGSGSQNPTTNESPSSINRSGQLDLNQRVAELRKSSVAPTNGVWVRNHSLVLLGHDDEASVTEKVRKPQLVLPSSSSSSQPNKEVGSTLISPQMKELLNAQLRYASSIRGRLMKPYHQYYSHQTRPTINGPFSPSPLMNETSRNINNHSAPPEDKDDDGIDDDGRIRSIPYKKNGPYTCSKCKQVFPTSQFFAGHVVSSHYKYETKAQRSKRLNARTRHRFLRLQQVNDGLTLVPVSSKVARNSSAGMFDQVNIKAESDHQGHD